MANLALVFDILAKDGASGPFKNVGNAAERAGQQTSKFGSAMSSALKLAGGALLGAGLVEGFKALYNAADESRKIGNLTAQVIKSTGGAANVSAKQVSDLAGAIAKKTGVDDEAIQSGQNLLLTFTNVKNEVGKGNDIFNRATQTITDMSVALGQDTSSSAIQLGKALNDPIKGVTALQRVGVSFTASQKEQIKTLVETGDTLGAQKLILAELGKEFGGAAEAAATPLGKLQQRVGDLAEKIGGYLVPIVDDAATFFMDKLLPALSDVGSVVAGVVVPTVRILADIVGGLADAYNALPGPVQAGVLALGAFALLKGPVSSAVETIGLKALYLKDAIANAGTGIGGFKGAASGLVGFLGGPWGIALGAATIGVSLLASWLGKNDASTQRVTQATQDYAGALRQANGVISESVRQAAAKAAQDAGLLDVAERAGVALPDVTSAITDQGAALDRTRGQLQQFIESHTRLITTQSGKGGAPQVTEALDSEGKAAVAALDALNKLSGQTTATKGDQQQLTEATSKGATAAQDFAQQIGDSRDALDEAKQAIDDYKLSLDILTGNSVSMIQVESALNDAIAAGADAMDNLGGAVLDSSGSLNLQTANGRKAADVLLDVRNSGNQLISTLIQQGATTDQVTARDAQLRASFIRTANQMGITGGNAEILADKILGIPGQRNTTITADTGQAVGAVANLQARINGLQGRTIAIQVRSEMPDIPGVRRMGAAIGGIVHAFAGGGFEPMRGGIAQVVPPNTWRVIGDRARDDEAYIPINGSSRSREILQQTAGRMGYQLASGGGSSTPVVKVEHWHSGGQSPMEVAESLAWMARTRG